MLAFRAALLTVSLCCFFSHGLGSLVKRSQRFPVYWNVPTETCHKYGFNFSELSKYGLIQNKNDKFRGEQITILYDPGKFPAILEGTYRNGGVPQEGNLKAHLAAFKNELLSSIPDPKFSGVGIIDFERWRPIWRENWGSLDIYRRYSKQVEKKKHPSWPSSKVDLTAKRRFEKAAYAFIEETLLLARNLRPRGVWGYYAYPYCFNFTPKNPVQSCTKDVIEDNNRSSWMYDIGTTLYPSIYMSEKELNEDKRGRMIAGRLSEAKRMASKQKKLKVQVLPYLAIKYQDTHQFLSKVDMSNGIKIPKKLGSQGVILWGASKDTNSAKKCQLLQDYVTNVIRPIIKNV